MKDKTIDSKMMKKFIDVAITRLEGDWIVIGGTVLPLLGVDLRSTVDIDLIQLEMKNSNQSSLMLMEIAESLGMPIETINQAGAYFLSKVEDVKEHLVLFRESKKCKIYRPDVYLYLKLKIARMSLGDLEDCLAFIKMNQDEFFAHKKSISTLLKNAIKSAPEEIKDRLKELQKKCS